MHTEFEKKSFSVFGIVVLLFCLFAAGCQNSAISDEQQGVYLFSFFKGNGDGLHLAWSADGLNWDVLNRDRPLLKPTAGRDKLMRDPCILKGPDGNFHMVWTVSWSEKGIGYASSKDLVNWSEQKYIPVMEHEPSAKNCWAPEVIYDTVGKQYIIFWATTIPGRFSRTESGGDNNHRIYCTTTKDFAEFSPTKLFYEPGFNVIDSTIVRAGKKYVMFLKNETRNPPQKNIRVAFADKAAGPYGPASESITGKYWAEGPTAVKIGDKWYVYFDKYTERKYGVVTSTDLENWQDISGQLRFPPGAKHGTIFRVSQSFFDNLLSQLNNQ